jgi:hypothetical protein
MEGSETSPSLIAAASPRSATSPPVNWLPGPLSKLLRHQMVAITDEGGSQQGPSIEFHRRYGDVEETMCLPLPRTTHIGGTTWPR